MGLFEKENKDCSHKKEITQPLKMCKKNKTINAALLSINLHNKYAICKLL